MRITDTGDSADDEIIMSWYHWVPRTRDGTIRYQRRQGEGDGYGMFGVRVHIHVIHIAQTAGTTHLAFSDMKLGFIGTGEITSSIVTGLGSSVAMPHSIRLSPRNTAIAKQLANRFNGVSISSCNQEVLDHCDTIVIAVRPQVARDVLSELHFRPDHQVVSLVSALSHCEACPRS